MITKKIFNDLAIYIIGFGTCMGIILPFFVVISGNGAVFTPLFLILSVLFGSLIGLFSVILSRKVIGNKIKELSSYMINVETKLMNKEINHTIDSTLDETCLIKYHSEDELGDSSKAFNSLVQSLSVTLKTEVLIKEFTETLSIHLDLDQLSRATLSNLLINLNAQGGAIIIEKEGELNLVTHSGLSNVDRLLTDDRVWEVLNKQKRMVIEFPDDIEIHALIVDFKPKTLLIEPINYKESCLGVIVIAGINRMEQSHLSLIQLFGSSISLAFRNSITYSQLERLAANDPLTGILNRRYGLMRTKEEFSRSIRYNLPIGAILLDIDHFKNINDTYGHIIGDKVLKSLAQTVKMGLREGDVFFRFGGEEFMIILPGAARKDVYKIAEQIRYLIQGSEVHHMNQIIKITISLGGSSFPEHEANGIDELIDFADQMLYRAKESGRNISIIE